MIISIRKMVSFIRFAALFAVLTLFFYYVLSLANQWISPTEPYREPAGHAVKAFQFEKSMDTWVTPRDRLRLYYWYGE
ncbi:DUF4227 family protein [Paenibacillus faecalis]|uniref:DUF4227 family protein n=1 Tax=Paenibacillus faecalis TaxID=2079532 RepID=UPI000D0EF21A|nr:DUF4227 family protein [Paenibacillus faecalis]